MRSSKFTRKTLEWSDQIGEVWTTCRLECIDVQKGLPVWELIIQLESEEHRQAFFPDASILDYFSLNALMYRAHMCNRGL